MEEAELTKMIANEDYSNLWRVPMSLGAPRKEKDKSGVECLVAEVAVNSAWFEATMVDSLVFTSFVVTVAMEGLGDKYGEEARLDRQSWTILKNKKFLGEKCPAHRIQVRPAAGIQQVEGGMGGKMVQELKAGEQIKGKVKEVPNRQSKSGSTTTVKVTEIEPKYQIIRKPQTDPVQLMATIWLPGVRAAKEVTLDIGEDRVVLVCTKQQYMLDIFLPHTMDSENTSATFQKDEQVLTVTIPLLE